MSYGTDVLEIMSFNPCFHGCRSGTMTKPFLIAYMNEFQSLFSWMSLWNQEGGDGLMAKKGFQSLFSWMSLWNIKIE